MSQQVGVLDITFTAGENLSEKQYYAVYLSADQTVSLCTTSYLNAIGILQNKPKSGEAAVIRPIGCGGTSKVKTGGAIAVGKRLKVDTDGMCIVESTPNATEQWCVGVALEASGADGDIIETLLAPFSLVKGTA